MEKEIRPADKQELLDVGNYETFNRDLMRKVFPRIISDIKSYKPRAKAGDVIPLYFILLTNMNGQPLLENGGNNPKYEACFLSQKDISAMTGIGINKIPIYADVLARNGLLFEIKDVWEGTNRYLFYYPSFCPRVTADGYIVDNNGEICIPEYEDISHKL